MPVKNISHDSDGNMMTRIPVKYKVSIGLPKGYKENPNAAPLSAPKKLFHFIVQSRNDDGEWEIDKKMTKELFGTEREPKSINIQLVGNSIDDMVIGDLFFWDRTIGAKCSCGTLKTFFEDWCNRNDIKWESPLSDVRSESELHLLLSEGKINKRISEFVGYAEKLIESYKEKMTYAGNYDVTLSDVIEAPLASRRIRDVFTPFPCLFRKCPDYMRTQCKYNGRFFFIFDGYDIGDIAMFVTTSPRNIRNIQWGLENIINKVVKSHSKEGLTMHGIPCRLVGSVERGTYTNQDGAQSSTKFFIVSLKGPHDNMIKSVKAILNSAREMKKYFPDGVDVGFDEGDSIVVAKERIDEFNEGMYLGEQVDNSEFKVEDEKAVSARDSKENRKEVSSVIHDNLVALVDDSDVDLKYLISEVGKALDKAPDSNGRNIIVSGLKKSLKEKTLTVDKLLKAQGHFDRIGCKIDLSSIIKKHKNKEK